MYSQYPFYNSPCCKKEFCLKCGHNDSHGDLTCKENMKLIIKQNEEDQTNNDLVQTLKWKLENRQVISMFVIRPANIDTIIVEIVQVALL